MNTSTSLYFFGGVHAWVRESAMEAKHWQGSTEGKKSVKGKRSQKKKGIVKTLDLALEESA